MQMTIKWVNIQEKNAGIHALASRVSTTHLFKWGEDVGRSGDRTIKEVIQAGGMNPTKKGGPRILRGGMIGSSGYLVEGGGGSAVVTAGMGINGGIEDYFTYQEGGTSRGVTPMLAIPMTELEMNTEMEDADRRMMKTIQGEWDAI